MMNELKIGDTIKCHDKYDLIDTFQELQKLDIDSDFIYEKDGEKGFWLVITDFLSDYPGIPNQFDNLTGSMNL